MMRHALILALLAAPAPTLAQDFSEGSQAKSWNLYGEVPATFEARVVDALCELTGDCPDDCGGGSRQLALVRSADNVMVMPLKNNQAAFSGAATDLAPYCGMTVQVDGLMIEDEDLGAHNVYMVQRVKAPGTDWKATNQFTKEWAKRHPEAKGKGPWFRRDPRINEVIGREGYLGLGLDVDEAYIAENY